MSLPLLGWKDSALRGPLRLPQGRRESPRLHWGDSVLASVTVLSRTLVHWTESSLGETHFVFYNFYTPVPRCWPTGAPGVSRGWQVGSTLPAPQQEAYTAVEAKPRSPFPARQMYSPTRAPASLGMPAMQRPGIARPPGSRAQMSRRLFTQRLQSSPGHLPSVFHKSLLSLSVLHTSSLIPCVRPCPV